MAERAAKDGWGNCGFPKRLPTFVIGYGPAIDRGFAPSISAGFTWVPTWTRLHPREAHTLREMQSRMAFYAIPLVKDGKTCD